MYHTESNIHREVAFTVQIHRLDFLEMVYYAHASHSLGTMGFKGRDGGSEHM